MKKYFYLTNGLTDLVNTDFEKPKNEESEEFLKWREHMDEARMINMSKTLSRRIESLGYSDWDDLSHAKRLFKTIAVTYDEAAELTNNE